MISKSEDKLVIFLSDYIFSVHPSAIIHIHGDVNIHHPIRTDEAGIFCQRFSLAYDQTQIVYQPSRVPATNQAVS